MSKLHGPDEGYKTVVRRTSTKKLKNEEKILRQKMADLLEDQEPVMKGPPFNPVIDLSSLSHDEFVNHARQVITTGNPQGHPPGMSSPTMQSLIDGLQVTRESYASVTKKSSPSESSYNGSVLTEDRESVTSIQVKTAKIATKVVKTTRVKFAPLELTTNKRSKATQHAVATLQDKSKASRSVGARQVKVTERLGDYASGTKQIASSAVGLCSSGNISLASSSTPTLTINLDRQLDDNSSSGDSSVIVFSPNDNKGDENDTDFPLITKVKRGQTGRHKEVASLNKHSHANFHQRSAEETDVSDSSSDDDADNGLFRTTSSSSSSTPAHLVFTKKETRYLQTGYEGQSFYDLVNNVDDMLGEEYIAPPLHRTSLLSSTALLQHHSRPPPMTDGDHLLSPAERDFCGSQQARWQVLYLAAKDFQAFPMIDHWKQKVLLWPVERHAHLVIIAGAFTNCVWPSSSTFQVDKQKFWVALSTYGEENFGSLFTRFKEVPFSAVTLEYLLLLPVSAIIGYLLHHHINYKETRWCNIGLPLEVIRQLYTLPAATKVHYTDWVAYVIDMAHYLHAIVCLPNDSYALLRSSVLADPVRLTTFDASRFVQYHFPLEHSRLNTEQAELSLLIRAAEFAFSETYSGDVFEQCSAKWAVLLYVIKTGHFPSNKGTQYRPDYDMVDCRTGLIDNSPEKFTRLFDFTRILHGPYRHLPHFLSEHALAIALYGTSVHTVTVGVQRLMVAGCLLYFYMLLHGRRYVDKYLPSSFLAHILHVGGVLAPTQQGITFSSKCIPIHFITTVHISVPALITRWIPLILVPPMVTIPLGVTNEELQLSFWSVNRGAQYANG